MEGMPEMEMGLLSRKRALTGGSHQCVNSASQPLLADQNESLDERVCFNASKKRFIQLKCRSNSCLAEVTGWDNCATSSLPTFGSPTERETRRSEMLSEFRKDDPEDGCYGNSAIKHLHKLHMELLRMNISNIVDLLQLPKDISNDVIFTGSNWHCMTVPRALKSSVDIVRMLEKRVLTTPAYIDSMVPIRFSARELAESSFKLLHDSWPIFHVASSTSCVSTVCLLLMAGANPLALDSRGRTALDVVGINRDQFGIGEIQEAGEAVVIRILLQLGVHYNVNMSRNDSSYYTLLFAGIYIEKKGTDFPLEMALRELLAAGAFSKYNDASKGAIKMLVHEKAREVLQLILDLESEHMYRYANFTLLTSVKEGWIDGVFIALIAGASIIEIEPEGLRQNSLHIASKRGHFDILNLLVVVAKYKHTKHIRYHHIKEALPRHLINLVSKERIKDNFEKILDYEDPLSDILNVKDKNKITPIHYAVLNKHVKCFELLLKNNASLTSFSPAIDVYANVMHVAVDLDQMEMVRLMLDHDISVLKAKDWLQRQPLHIACLGHKKDMIIFLLTKGSQLFAKDHRSCTPFKLITDNFTDPAEIFEEVFNRHIVCYPRRNNWNTYKVNYSILRSDNKNLEVIEALIRSGCKDLLAHPLIESFLHLKWKSLAHLFYASFAVYLSFVLTLNLVLVPWFYFKDKKEETPRILNPITWGCLLCIMLSLLAVQEVLRIKTCSYYIQLETWLNWSIIVITITLPFVLIWESPESEWGRFLATADLLLSWMELTVLISRIPDWGVYLLMFGKVSCKIVKILLIFSFPIIGFSLAFMVQFQHKAPFNGLMDGFKKTLVMMTGEFDYSDTFSDANFTTGVIFVAFVILIYMTLMNLMVGVSINDTNQLQEIGNIRKLEKQVDFLASLERNICLKYLKEKIFDRWFDNFVPNTIDLYDAYHLPKSRKEMLPKHIKEAIIETAKAWKSKCDEDSKEKYAKDKMCEIHDAVLKADDELRKVIDTFNNEVNKLHEECANKDKIIEALTKELDIKNKTCESIKEKLRTNITHSEDVVPDGS